jgi:hypothetical protein
MLLGLEIYGAAVYGTEKWGWFVSEGGSVAGVNDDRI